MVTSINGNNVTWVDDKTGESVTDPHNDLEIMMKKGGKVARRRKQRGGDIRPRGLVQQGSGDIDPTSQYGLPVDDVRAIIGRGEYVVNKNAVDAVGEEFLDDLNSIGIGNPSNIPQGTGKYGGYQRGGRVRKQTGGNNMARNRTRKQRGGRGRKRFQAGGHTHPHHYHSAYVPPDGEGIMGVTGPSLTGWDNNWGDDSLGDHGHNFSPGDMNHDGGYNVLDIVALSNCVLAGNCNENNQGASPQQVQEARRRARATLQRQRGGRTRRQTGGSNGQCGPNQHWMPPTNGQPGYCMEGKTHPSGGMYQGGGKMRTKPVVRKQQGGGSQYVIANSNIQYDGPMVEFGGIKYTTTGSTLEGGSQALVLQSEIGRG